MKELDIKYKTLEEPKETKGDPNTEIDQMSARTDRNSEGRGRDAAP